MLSAAHIFKCRYFTNLPKYNLVFSTFQFLGYKDVKLASCDLAYYNTSWYIIGIFYYTGSRVSQTTRPLSFSQVPFRLEAWNKKSAPNTKSELSHEIFKAYLYILNKISEEKKKFFGSGFDPRDRAIRKCQARVRSTSSALGL